MGTVYLKQEYQRIILRHYDGKESDIVNEFVHDRLQEENLLNGDGEYTPDGTTTEDETHQ